MTRMVEHGAKMQVDSYTLTAAGFTGEEMAHINILAQGFHDTHRDMKKGDVPIGKELHTACWAIRFANDEKIKAMIATRVAGFAKCPIPPPPSAQ